MNIEELIASLNPADLVLNATPLVLWEMGGATDMESTASFMYQGGMWPPQASAKRRPPPRKDERPEKKYWVFVKEELTAFLCTNDKKYKELWARINGIEKQGTSAVVLVVSGYLGEKHGLQASVLAGFVAVVFYGALKIGTQAFCQYAQSET